MSLDVHLEIETPRPVEASDRIFIREQGAVVEITHDEWTERFPGRVPVVVHDPKGETGEVYSANITHNLGKMAGEAGVYKALWRPEEIGVSIAEQLIPLLDAGLTLLRSDPARFKALNPENGWGTYDGLVRFVDQYLVACRDYPQAKVTVSR